MPRRETRGSQLNSLRWLMSFVSRTSLCFGGTSAPSLGRAGLTSAPRDLTAGAAADGPASALPCLLPEPVVGTCTRPRGRFPDHVRRRQRERQGRIDSRHRVAPSRVRAHAQRRWCPNSHGGDARGRLRRAPHREQTRGVGSPYLAARKSPPDDARPIASKRLAQNANLSLHYPLLPCEGVEWVEE